MECMQYTIRGVPAELDMMLRGCAKREEKSLNTVLLEALQAGVNFFQNRPKNAELLELAGTWQDDPECEAALTEMERIDEAMWK